MKVKVRRASCGVIVTDGQQILLGHATRSPRWDIPKGIAEAGENFAQAAVRELREETGLVALPDELIALGVHPYLRGKDLALFAWQLGRLPDPKGLTCVSPFRAPGWDLAAGIRPLWSVPVGRGAHSCQQEFSRGFWRRSPQEF